LSAHQTEGVPVDSDWWRAAQEGRVPDPQGALGFWERFREDIQTVRALGLDAFRFSLEWARIEPQPGVYDEAALARYRAMVECAWAEGLLPLVTLHHFTLPGWLVDRGGLWAEGAAQAFARYAAVVARRLPEPYALLTINEPVVLAVMGYLLGHWPPFHRSWPRAVGAARQLAGWHRQAAQAVHAVRPQQKVGLAKHATDLRPCDAWAVPTARAADLLFHEGFLGLLGPLDVLGINYYTGQRVTAAGRLLPFGDGGDEMGWASVPEGLRRALRRLRRFAPEVWVTENGVATEDDRAREAYIAAHLRVAARLWREGYPLRGYLYWTLYDNYEWHHGYTRHFGLGDRARRLRPVATKLPALWQGALKEASLVPSGTRAR
jgi:beta-glucosidase